MWSDSHLFSCKKRLIFTRKVFRFASLWKWEFLKLGNDLFNGQRLEAQFGSISWLNSFKTWPQKWTEVYAKRAQESLLLVRLSDNDWLSLHVTQQNGVAFSLHWTGYNTFLTVNASLQDQTCGLCGTFNGMKEDDFHLRSGDDKVSLDEFAREWLVPDLSEDKCSKESVESSINYCDIYLQNKNWTHQQCNVIKGTIWGFVFELHSLRVVEMILFIFGWKC